MATQGKPGLGEAVSVALAVPSGSMAFRAEDDDELESLREKVLEMGLSPSQVIDRHWFYSVYFQSPRGVLFEIATDGSGYDVDKDSDELSQKLILPPWLEYKREMIEKRLPEMKV